MKKLMATLLLLTVITASAQKKIRELSIGDRCPALVLPSVLNNSGKPLTLSSLKGKIVILDFMRVNCSGCIAALPKMEKLQQQFKNKLQFIVVTIDSKQLWQALMQKNRMVRDNKLPVVVSDKLLSAYFTYQSIPHEVWLDESGVVRAITSSEYLTASNIQSMLDKIPLNWPVKKDIGNYTFDLPMLSLNESEQFNGPMYYTTFTGYRPGTNPAFKIRKDTANNTSIFTIINQSIPSLYQTVLKGTPLAALGGNRFMVEVSAEDSIDLFWAKRKTFGDAWSAKNKFCLEAILPVNIPASERSKLLVSYLNTVTPYYGAVEKRKMSCFIIIKKTGSRSTQDKRLLVDSSAESIVFSNLNELAYDWNISASSPLLLNEAGNENIAALKFNRKARSDMEEMKKCLNNYELDIVKEEREVEVFVLSKK